MVTAKDAVKGRFVDSTHSKVGLVGGGNNPSSYQTALFQRECDNLLSQNLCFPMTLIE